MGFLFGGAGAAGGSAAAGEAATAAAPAISVAASGDGGTFKAGVSPDANNTASALDSFNKKRSMISRGPGSEDVQVGNFTQNNEPQVGSTMDSTQRYQQIVDYLQSQKGMAK